MLESGEVLLGFDDRSRRMAAEALSEVHARFLGWETQLSAVPSLTEQYLQDFIVSRCWRGTWTTACGDERFVGVFRSWIGSVEASAARLPSDLLAFSQRFQLNTLTHTDIHHGRIMDDGDRALIIDWSQARCAPLFLDLGDTFDIVESGWIYRDALAARGCVFDDDVFSRGHLLARRFAGVRYLAYGLQSWLDLPQEWNRTGLERTLAMAAGKTNESGS